MRLLALDPGLRGCGVAVFNDEVLAWAGYTRNPVKGDGLDAVVCMARAVKDVVPVTRDVGGVTVVAERMQVYTAGKGKGDPNDLIPLAAIVGGIAAMFCGTTPRTPSTWYKPREWKSTMPKGDAFTARVLERLSEFERSAIHECGALSHNVYDAIGIGLFHLGRFTRRRVIAR